jgi:hypothetical protein
MNLHREENNLDPSSDFFEYADSVCKLLSEQAHKIQQLLQASSHVAKPKLGNDEKKSTV